MLSGLSVDVVTVSPQYQKLLNSGNILADPIPSFNRNFYWHLLYFDTPYRRRLVAN